MNITGQIVKHKIWGEGEIIAFDQNDGNKHITVKFAIGEKLFGFPIGFEKFLVAVNEEFKSFVADELQALAIEKENELALREIERDKRVVHNEKVRLANTRRVY
ncbi:MAG: hypothetical protein K2N50_04615, partial [Clostridia bacterium]|nr:hypothetical protein [Clostridia bacterium]